MKKIKSILSTILISIFTLTSMVNVNALEANEIESGIYEVENDIYHEQEIGMTMSRTYTLPTMKIEKSREGIFFTLGFTGTDYMENYRIFVDGEDVNAEIVEENEEEKSIYLRFETESLEPNIQAKIYVDAMERDVEFDVITKTDTIKLIEKIEEPEEVEQEEVEQEDVNPETNVSDVNESSNNNTAFIIIGAIAVIAVAVFAFVKLKK
ncbi:MAG: NEAT domain-containing protein [Peptostreptococcaceae bacterium]